ncbi:MAG: tyrosine-type recombinase/integrase [Candidatus Dormibacteraceae bacterium]
MFTGPAGEPLNPATVSREFRAILERAQLPRIRFHDLRHANASLMLTAHVPMEMLSKLLGHSNPTTTQNIYAHVLQPLREEAKRAQAGILGG